MTIVESQSENYLKNKTSSSQNLIEPTFSKSEAHNRGHFQPFTDLSALNQKQTGEQHASKSKYNPKFKKRADIMHHFNKLQTSFR